MRLLPTLRMVRCAHCGHSQRRIVKMRAWQSFRCRACGWRFTWLHHPTGNYSQPVLSHDPGDDLHKIVRGYFKRGFDDQQGKG